MDSLVLAAQILLAAIFVTAGVGKLLDLGGTRASLQGFGVPQAAGRLLTPLLPLAELAVAVMLIPASTARWAALGAATLLLAFAAGIATAMVRGRAPDCHCFGSLHSAPAGRATLARNLALAALAGVVVWQAPSTEVGEWVDARTSAELVAVAAGAAALALMMLSFTLWSRNRDLSRALMSAREEAPREREPEGLPVGMPAPPFELQDLRGQTHSLESLRAGGRQVLLVFLDPACGPCHGLVPHIARWRAALGDWVAICVISEGDPERAQAAWGQHDLDVVVDRDTHVTRQAYKVLTWPSALAIGPDGKVAQELVYSQDAMEVVLRIMLQELEPSRPQQPLRVTTVDPSPIQAS